MKSRFSTRLSSVSVILLALGSSFATQAWAQNCTVCRTSKTSSPLGPVASSALNLKSVEPSVSDLDWYTPEDFKYCPDMIKFLTGKIMKEKVNPHTLPDDGSVWRVGTHRWTAQWEDEYAKWFKREIDDNFFVRYKIPTDCADAALSARAIFSRIHHLPALFRSKTTDYGSGSKAWKHLSTVKNWDDSNWKQALSTDLRFRAYLTEMTLHISTDELKDSTYPISLHDPKHPHCLNPQIGGGTVLYSQGHTRIVSGIEPKGYIPIEQVNSTSPRAMRTLLRGSTTVSWPQEQLGEGVLEFNWPVNCQGSFQLVADQRMPGYSLEQYEISKSTGEDMNDYLADLVPGERKPADRRLAEILAGELKVKMDERIATIRKGEALRKVKPGIFKDPQLQEDYSTPHLDEMISEKYDRSRIKFEFKNAQADYFDRLLKQQVISIDGVSSTNVYYMIKAIKEKGRVKQLSDPESSLAERMGLPYLIEREAELNQNSRNSPELKEIQALLGKRARRRKP